MKHIVTVAVLLAALIAPAAVQAEIYKCTEGGKTVFSDRPCDVAAAPMQIRLQAGEVDPARAAEAVEEVRNANYRARKATAQNNIKRLEDQLNSTLRAMDAELSYLRSQKRLANNNLAGATYLNSISSEMQAVSTRYDVKIRDLQAELERARRVHDAIRN